jgi:hypothetical protein
MYPFWAVLFMLCLELVGAKKQDKYLINVLIIHKKGYCSLKNHQIDEISK